MHSAICKATPLHVSLELMLQVFSSYHAATSVFSGEEPYSGVRLTLKIFGSSRFNIAFEI